MSLLYRTLVQQGTNIWPEDYVALSRTVSRAPWRILKLFFLKSVIFCIRNGPCSSHAWVWNNSRLRWESKRPPWQLRIGSRARGEIFSVSEHGLKVLDANFYSRTVWNRFQIGGFKMSYLTNTVRSTPLASSYFRIYEKPNPLKNGQF